MCKICFSSGSFSSPLDGCIETWVLANESQYMLTSKFGAYNLYLPNNNNNNNNNNNDVGVRIEFLSFLPLPSTISCPFGF